MSISFPLRRYASGTIAERPSSLTFGQKSNASDGDVFENRQSPVKGVNRQSGIAISLLPLPIGKANTTEAFIRQMEKVIAGSSWVRINQERLAEVARSFEQAPKLLDWKGYISDEAFNANPPDLNRAMFELALNIANQSGFITGSPGRKAKKWELGGSGASAMVQVLGKIREAGLLPGLDLKDPDKVPGRIGPLLKGVPFRKERLAIFQEFAQHDAAQNIARILEQARTGQNSYRLTFASMKALAEALPASFGGDPFYKKACLLMLAMAGFGRPRGVDVQLDLPVAADYRLPQTLEKLGILQFSPQLDDALSEGKSFHEDHPAVQHLRAASIVASDSLSRQTGFDSAAIDGLLWSAARNQPRTETAKPHMMVPTMRF